MVSIGVWSVIIGVSIFGLAPVNVTNTNLNVSGSVVGFQGGTTITSISGTVIVGSIVGTYVEDAGHSTGASGLFILGVRNDAVASFVSADLEYTPIGVDSAGRTIIKPFAPDQSRLDTSTSIVSTSVTALFASVIGLRNYVTDVTLANTGSVATLITFSDGSTSILGYTIAPAGGGSNIIHTAIPMRTATAQDFRFQPGTAASILYISARGYQAP